MFRTSGHQNPVEVQQTRCPGKVTLTKIMKSYLKVIPFYLWVKQFCRAGNSLKIQINIKQQVFPTPPTLTLGLQTIKTLTKSTCTQVKQAPARRNECNQGSKLISFKILLQKDTRFCSQYSEYNTANINHKVTTNNVCPLPSFNPLTGPT